MSNYSYQNYKFQGGENDKTDYSPNVLHRKTSPKYFSTKLRLIRTMYIIDRMKECSCLVVRLNVEFTA